jgi:uncharacterized membrane protein
MKLEREVPGWVEAGIISPAQAEAILMRHPNRAAGRWMVIFGTIGSVLCLAGVSLLIASNWQAIPPLVKLGGLLTLLAGSMIFAVEAQARGAHRAGWECGYLVASVCPLLGLALISQIFHLDGKMSGLLAAWFGAIVVLPFASRSVAAFVVLIIAGYAWLGTGLDELSWLKHFRSFAFVYMGVGAALAAGSQLWLMVGAKVQRSVGEFVGVATVALMGWLAGFDMTMWVTYWVVLFVAALGWIWLSLERERPHQLNVGFVLVGLLIVSTFLRLAGTMANTGLLFLSGGVVLLVTACLLQFLRRALLNRRS